MIDIDRYINGFTGSALAQWRRLDPWELVAQSAEIVRDLFHHLPSNEYLTTDEIAAHPSAIVERGATLKGPLILGPGCFVAAGASLRGGCWLERDCIIGPGSELKSSFLFGASKLTHLNFVGDSVLGSDVILEAGSIIFNQRNERTDKDVRVRIGGRLQRTGCDAFGALVGDRGRIGANAVVAPGAVLPRDSVVPRGGLCDQEIDQVTAAG